MKKNSIGYVISILYIPLSLIYYEVILKVFCKLNFNIVNIFVLILVAGGTGLLCDIFCSLSKRKTFDNILGFIFVELSAIIFMITYFVYDSFSAFMSIESLADGTEGVVTQFGDTILTVIKNGWFQILIFEIPMLLYILFFFILKLLSFHKVKGLAIGFFAFIFIIFEIVGILLINSSSHDRQYLRAIPTSAWNSGAISSSEAWSRIIRGSNKGMSRYGDSF